MVMEDALPNAEVTALDAVGAVLAEDEAAEVATAAESSTPQHCSSRPNAPLVLSQQIILEGASFSMGEIHTSMKRVSLVRFLLWEMHSRGEFQWRSERRHQQAARVEFPRQLL